MVLLSILKLLQTSNRSTENGITFPDLVENPGAFPVTINITVSLMSSITLIFSWTHTNFGTWFQQLLCYSTTSIIDALCPISTRNHQLTNLAQTHIRGSLHCERWTVKRRDYASVLHSFNGVTYQTDEWTKQLLRLKSWVLISVKIVVGNVPQPMTDKCCVGVRFFASLFFLLLTQKTLEKVDGILTKVVLFFFHKSLI